MAPEERVVAQFHIGGSKVGRVTSRTGIASFSFRDTVKTSEVHGPVSTFAWLIDWTRDSDEHFGEREVMTNGILPAITSCFIIRVVVHDPGVNLVESELFSGRAQDRIGD